MRPRAIRDLVQLSDSDLFEQVSIGIGHIASNAKRLADDAAVLEEAKKPRGFSVIASLLNEEAAKILILLDAVRCPRKPPEILSSHLSKFNDHLAKGIYADATYWSMPTFEDLIKAVDETRQQYHLDGPNDVDWIFRNRVLAEREETLYVDYIDTGESHYWHVPRIDYFFGPPSPMSWVLSQALVGLGCTSPASLSLIAYKWRPVQIKPETDWPQTRKLNWATLVDLDSEGHLSLVKDTCVDRDVRIILDSWQFPMYALNLALSSEDNRAQLKKIQNELSSYL